MFTTCYAALHPETVKSMVLTITPIDFHGDTVENRLGHGFINLWTRSLPPEDIDRLIDAYGNLPGEFMGSVFSQMTPMRTLMKYNLDLLEVVDDEKKFLNFLRMEKWIADRPHHPGEAAKQWLKDLYQDNKLINGTFTINGRHGEPRQHHDAGAQRVRQRRSHHPACDLAGAWREGRHQGLHGVGAARRPCRRVRRRQVAGSARVRGSRTGWPRGLEPMTLKNKIVSADEAIAIVRDGDTMCVSGFVGIGTPDELILALERRFLKERHPSGLTLVFAAAPGDGKERGLNRLAHKGLIKRVVGGHWSLVPKLGELALNNEIEAYNLPLGVISHLYREIAARRPGAISKVGMRTFVDPREQGGKLNSVTTEDLVELLDNRRRGMAALQVLPDQRRLHPRHDLRSERQRHDGA